jgi:cytochrome c-type biogenesis protein CcmF
VFIAILLVISIALMATRGHLLVPEGQLSSVVSRETSILVNNLVFVGITFTVLLGTLYPLISEAVRGVRVSVGEPYFNKMAVPGGIAVLFLMGVGPMLPWGTPDKATVRRQFIIPASVGLVVAVACYLAGLRGLYPLLTFGLAGFVTVITLGGSDPRAHDRAQGGARHRRRPERLQGPPALRRLRGAPGDDRHHRGDRRLVRVREAHLRHATPG